MKLGVSRSVAPAVAIALLCSPAALATSQVEVKLAKPASTERHERAVDHVALASQQKAVSTLSKLLHRYRGTAKEPVLLAKLAELQTQMAAIRFRIANGSVIGTSKPVDLGRYHQSLREAVKTLSELIARFPHYQDIAHVWFMRGKNYEDLEQKDRATKDYLYLVKAYPEAPETLPSYMSLAQFAIDANNHPRAIGFLKEVEKHPESQFYPFALYKLAWSYYNLKDIPTALSYAERHVAYYDRKIADETADPALGEGPAAATSDLALRENSLLDATVFYLEGYEENASKYSVSDAYDYFRKLNRGPELGKMLVRYAKLLRAHEHEQDLIRWKDLVVENEPTRPEALDVVLTTYEHQMNDRKYDVLSKTALDLITLHKTVPTAKSFAKAQKMLLDTAADLRKLLLKNKGASNLKPYTQDLASIYDTFTKIVDETDPRIPRVHYNLAETLFAIQDYDQATIHYRWVVEHGKWNRKDNSPASVADASLKAISSRYEVLRSKKLIPKELTAKAFQREDETDIDSGLAEWVAWIDRHVEETQDDSHDPIDNFSFEAMRALYAADRVHDSVDRMIRFAKKHPGSKFAIPAASLALDTYVASASWKDANDLALDLMDVKAWKKGEFSKKLFTVAADSAYKLIEGVYQSKDYKGALSEVDDFIEKYATSPRIADCLALAGNSALRIEDNDRAMKYFSQLIQKAPNSPSIGQALLARARLEEARYDFLPAARDYRAYLTLPADRIDLSQKEQRKLKSKALALAWLSGDPSELSAELAAKGFCDSDHHVECDRYQGLIALARQESSPEKKLTDQAFDRSRKAPSDNRALWAAVALEGAKNLPFRDRLVTLRRLATGWDDLDPLVQFTLVPTISQTIPQALELDRVALKRIAPLRADERWIRARVDKLREIENAATKIMKDIPWSRVRALTLNQVAVLYLDLSRELQDLKPPKGLPQDQLDAYNESIEKIVMPFEEKAEDIRGKAYELASSSAIEKAAFHQIADPYFEDNPSLASRIRPTEVHVKPEELNLETLDQLDSSGDWDDLDADAKDVRARLQFHWANAIQKHLWPQIAFFLQEAHEKDLFTDPVQGVMKAVALAAAGAQGEAVHSLEEASDDLKGGARTRALRILVDHYYGAFARKKAESLVKELAETDPGLASELQGKVAWADQQKPRAPASTHPAKATDQRS